MKTFFDASALVKRYMDEAGSQEVDKLPEHRYTAAICYEAGDQG